ncbi:MAG: radical SAM protein [Synergistaceae bacterium]|nr:radical SAM protein [Synergistota bacterium]NLM72035.1 radical SAM protein [Synergistaceae bacterium]
MSARSLPPHPFFLPMVSCPRRCVYCDQSGITGISEAPSPAEVESVLADLVEPREVCFFGGSFTCFSEDLRKAYMDSVKAAPEGSVFRLSTHPLCISGTILDELSHRPVSMVEIGVSSLDDSVLAACNRGYTGEHALSVMVAILERGLPLGVQLMIGLPGQSPGSELGDLERIASLRKEEASPGITLRLYPCLVLEGTRLALMTKRGEYEPLSLEEAVSRAGEVLYKARRLGLAVQRVGLHETESLSRSVIAGPHHPAFGEMAGSVALVKTLLETSPEGPWKVDERRMSFLLGHGRFGLRLLSRSTGIPLPRLRERIIFCKAL